MRVDSSRKKKVKINFNDAINGGVKYKIEGANVLTPTILELRDYMNQLMRISMFQDIYVNIDGVDYIAGNIDIDG